jgi:single-stranded-DNA-specific exonuclease
MNRRWLISRANPDFVHYLSKAVSISPVLAQVLVNRGIKNPGDVQEFLSPGITALSDPFELPGIRTALERIKGALRRGERVLVHGDYDTDGLTATAIMVLALGKMGMDVHYFIPHRVTQGYGFHPYAVDAAKKLGASLIITVDCGITSLDAVAYAQVEGIDVIITDHHEPTRRDHDKGQGTEEEHEFLLPDAVAIINPKLNMENQQLFLLSGAGIAFKIVQAFAMDDMLPFTMDDALSLLDLAALGTIADVVPFTAENRIILKEGLKQISHAHRPGIKSLMEVSGVRDREIRAGLLSFTLIPRINASGRIGDTGDVMRLFLSDSGEESFPLAEKLDRTNTERQKIEQEAYEEARSQLNEKGFDSAIVLANRNWHIGVVGIVASRIAEEFNRPTFVLSMEDDIAKGSARSIPAFDVYQGLSECSDVLLSFGGHRQAAGLKLRASDIPQFEKRINDRVRDSLRGEDLTPVIEIHAEVVLSEVTTSLVRELSLLEPVGFGNPEPTLGARMLDVLNPRIVGKNHLKMKVKQKALSLDVIGFDMGRFLEHLSESSTVDAAFTPGINEWNGGKYLQLSLKAIRPSG